MKYANEKEAQEGRRAPMEFIDTCYNSERGVPVSPMNARRIRAYNNDNTVRLYMQVSVEPKRHRLLV